MFSGSIIAALIPHRPTPKTLMASNTERAANWRSVGRVWQALP